MTSPQTHNWELLGQLALCGQDSAITDTQALTQKVADLLKHALACSRGTLAVLVNGSIYAQTNWSCQAQQEPSHEIVVTQAEPHSSNHSSSALRLSLRNDNNLDTEEIGYLLLTYEDNPPDSETPFYQALTAQLTLLFSRQRHRDIEREHFNQWATRPSEQEQRENTHRNQVSHSNELLDLIEETENELEILHRLSLLAATTRDSDYIYRLVVEAVARATDASYTRLIIYDRKRGTSPVAAEYTRSGEQPPFAFPLIGNPATAWLDTHKKPILSSDAQHDPLLVSLHDIYREYDIRSAALIPMLVNGEVLGCLEIDFVDQETTIRPERFVFCETVAYQAARVVENMRLFQEAQTNAQALQGKVGELSTLLEAARILGSLLQPDEVLNNLMDLVSRQLGVSTVALWTIGNGNTLTPAAMDGIPLEMAREMRVPVGHGLTGKVADTGMPLIVPDVNDQGESLYPDFNRRNRLRSFMGVPVFYRERIIGVLSVMTSEYHEFTTDEMMLMVGLAGQAAVALENARLFQDRERRINELMTINQISSAVNSTLDLDEMLLVLHCGISEVLDTTFSFIGVYDTEVPGQSPILRQRIARHGRDETIHHTSEIIPLDGRGLVDYVVLETRPLLLQTTEEIEQFMGQHLGEPSPSYGTPDELPSSWLGVPVMLGDTILGIISLHSLTPYAYTQDDMRFLSTVASQAAIAISNARLFSERERRLREITVLKDIGSAISSTLDLQSVIERLYHEMSQAIDMSTSLIGLYDEETDILSYPICYDQGQRLHFEAAPLQEGTSCWVIRNRQPLLIHTAEQSEQMGLSEFGYSVYDLRSGLSRIRHPRSRQVQSLLIVPIISSDSVLGVVKIKSYRTYAFDEDDLRFVVTVANQVAITISNVYMFQERERRIQELATFNEIGQALSSTVSIEELPLLIYRQTSRLLDTTNFYMALFDELTGEITFPVFYEQGVSYHLENVKAQWSESVYGLDIPINPGLYQFTLYLIRRVIQKRETLLLKGSDMDHVDINQIEELKEEIGPMQANFVRPRSWLGVPMIAADKVVGVIGIQSYENKKAYGPYDVHLLSTIASWSAIALENARLFDEISNLAASLERHVTERTIELREANAQLLQEKEHLETIHTITLELTATLNLDEIISRALEMASTNLGVSRGSIMLREVGDGTLICRAVLHDRGIVHPAEVPISFENGEGLAGWVLQNHEPVYIPDVRDDTRWVVEPGRADDVRSVVATPLMTGDTTLGVLILTNAVVDYFSESQVRLLATIANEVAIAINNAQLYNYITEMATRLADLLEQQKEENTRSHAILQSLTEGVIVLDEEQHIQLMNWAAEHMLDIPADQVLGQHVDILETYGETESQYKRASILYENLQTGLQKASDQEAIYSMSIEFPRPEQEQIIAMNVATVRSVEEQVYGNVAVLRDITREIESDRTKREFISKVSHELRTPLTSIKGYVDVLLLKSMGDLNESQIGFLNVVKTNSNRLMDLINDILDISRIESGKIQLNFTRVNLHDVFEDVDQSLKLEVESKSLTVTSDIAEELPFFMADEKRLTQIIFNLYSNAVKYTFDHGHIHVRAFLNPAHMIQVEVEDNGVGMTPEQCQKLFRPFYRADNPLRDVAGGTGLGLSITKSLIEQHGGELWVRSEQGKGSTFSLVLPLEQPEKKDEGNESDEEPHEGNG